MKRWIGIGMALLVGMVMGAGLFTGIAVVRAQEPTPTPFAGAPYRSGGGMGMMRGGRMGAMMGRFAERIGMGTMRTYMHTALAAQLDMTVEEYETAWSEGKSFWSIAEEKGFTQTEAEQMMVDARSAAFDQAVSDGVITQEQADLMKERMSNMPAGGCMGGRGARGTYQGPTN